MMLEMMFFGLIVGIIVSAKPINVFLRELDDTAPGSFAYILLGCGFFMASWAIGWIGFFCALVPFLLYQYSVAAEAAMADFFSPIVRCWRWCTNRFFNDPRNRPELHEDEEEENVTRDAN